jgi:hypothetical protein
MGWEGPLVPAFSAVAVVACPECGKLYTVRDTVRERRSTCGQVKCLREHRRKAISAGGRRVLHRVVNHRGPA